MYQVLKTKDRDRRKSFISNFTIKSGKKKLQECKTKKFLLTICTSLTELMLSMYIVTPTFTGGPRSKIQ